MAIQYVVLIYAVLTSILFFGTNILGQKLEWKQKTSFMLFIILDAILIIVFLFLFFNGTIVIE
ncbi:hypothetical protein SAMN06265361_1109 [Laceyella tengchongensis]|jgi:hypothetical protein|uniref:Uncharacterized protein n=1 Tax=Laceyella tengchongensis TaxID=574699 RepID=A0AA45WS22_9BACL|nr:hypothetical protein SAMN06265361_1109 [Laceyella tengchongensis]